MRKKRKICSFPQKDCLDHHIEKEEGGCLEDMASVLICECNLMTKKRYDKLWHF
jgi:hypothetical protein